MKKRLKEMVKYSKILKYLLTKINLVMLLILFLLIYLVSTIDNGAVNTTIDLKNLEVYKIAVSETSSNYEIIYNIGIAIITGLIVSYNHSKYNEFQEKKNLLRDLEENMNNFIRCHLNFLFSNKLLNEKLLQKSNSIMNKCSNVLIYKKISIAYQILKELIEAEHAKIFLEGNEKQPLRLKYMDYIYKLQKEYYIKNHQDFLKSYSAIKQKEYLFSSKEKLALNNIATLLFKVEDNFRFVNEYEQHNLIKGTIESIYIGKDLKKSEWLTYSKSTSNAAFSMNYFYDFKNTIQKLEAPLQLCKTYLEESTYCYGYSYESQFTEQKSFRENLYGDILEVAIKESDIKLSNDELEKIKNSEIVSFGEKIETSGILDWNKI